MSTPTSILTSPLTDLDLAIEGTWPSDISGDVFISAPVGDPRLTYQLFGFGAMVRLTLTPGRHGAGAGALAWRVHELDTPIKRLHDKAAGRFTGGTMGLDSPYGHANMANTAPLQWNGRLFATWDVGRPVEIDPLTMAFLGEVGSSRSWGGDSFGSRTVMPQIFSTAHPVVDHERSCMWTVKLVFTAGGLQPHVVRYDGTTTEVTSWPLDGALVVGSMHTVSQSRDWLVMADSGNFKADMNEVFGGERTVTIDERVPVYFVRKDELLATAPGTPVQFHRAEFGPTTGHYYAQWDDSSGVRVLFEHMNLTDLGYRLRADDVNLHGEPIATEHRGFYQMGMSRQTMSEMCFRPERGEVSVESVASHPFMWNVQLSASASVNGDGHDSDVHHVVTQGFRPDMLARRVLDIYGERVDASTFVGADTRPSLTTFEHGGLRLIAQHRFAGPEDLPTSPALARSLRGGAGHVIVPVLNDDGFRVECFDAADVSKGPVAVARAPRGSTVPFLLHAIWMEQPRHQDVDRVSFADEIDDRYLASLDDEGRNLVLAVADDLRR